MKSILLKKGLWLAATIIAEYVLLKILQKQEQQNRNPEPIKKPDSRHSSSRSRKARKSSANAHHGTRHSETLN